MDIGVPAQKILGRAIKFCLNFVIFAKIMIFYYFTDKTKKLSEILLRKPHFVPTSWCSLKKVFTCNQSHNFRFLSHNHAILWKKRSSLKFGNCFLQLVIVAALKFLILPKFLILLLEKF